MDVRDVVLANDDYRWYATSGSCTTAPGLTQVTSRITGPVFASRGSVVAVTVHGPANASVAVYMHQPGGEFRLARSGRLDQSGTFRTSYVARRTSATHPPTGPDPRAAPRDPTLRRAKHAGCGDGWDRW